MDPRTNQIIYEIQGKVDSLVKLLGSPLSGPTTQKMDPALLAGALAADPAPVGGGMAAETLPTVLDAIARMTCCLQESKLYQQVVQGALDITEAQRGFLMVMEDGSKLRWKKGINITQAGLMSGKEGSRSVIKDVVKGGKPVLRGPEGQPGTKSMIGNALDSVLCIPIPIGKRIKKSNSKNNVAGILYVDSKGMSGSLDKNCEELLVFFGKHVSIALENAWLYSKA